MSPTGHSIGEDLLRSNEVRTSILLNVSLCLFSVFSILFSLADANHVLLKGFICVLHRISQNGQANGMTPFNLGLCVSNSLFKTESTTIVSGKQEADVMSSIVEFLIENCAALFGADVMSCIVDKRILVQKTSSLSTCPSFFDNRCLEPVEFL